MLAASVFDSAKLKVERANLHINELRRASEPLHKSFYSLDIHRHPAVGHTQATKQVLVYRPVQKIPETFALIIGDAVHNPRAALDHLVTSIARTVEPSVEIHFPMRKNREDIVTPSGSAKKAFESVEKALPGFAKLFTDEVRPANNAFDKYWGFHALDNADKHNLLVPVVTVVNITGIGGTVGKSVIAGNMVGGRANQPINVLSLTGQNITINEDVETTVTVKFGDGTPFQDDPVIPTLMQISKLTRQTIEIVERFAKTGH